MDMTALGRGLALWINNRVAEGAAWLDDVAPGWEGAIDPARLDMASGYSCIAGQVGHAGLMDSRNLPPTSGFGQVSALLGGNVCRAYGMFADDSVAQSERTLSAEYALLGDRWLHVIKLRHDLGTLSG